MRHHQPLRPDRLRNLERPFGWIPLRLLSSGWLQRLGRDAKLLYFFLCLVADRRGISYYGDALVCQRLGLSAPELAQARQELCHSDLLAFDGRVYQLLSLPRDRPASKPACATTDRRAGQVEHIASILRQLSEAG